MKDMFHAALLDLLLEAPVAAVPVLLPQREGERAALWACAQDEKCHLNLALYWRSQGGAAFAEQADLEVAPQRQERSIDIVRRLPASAVLLKGPALHRHYPPGVDRFSVDIDVLIADPTALREVHASVLPAGYVPDGSGYWQVPLRAGMAGLFASLRYWTPERTKATTSMEIQIGGFPISWERVLPFDVLARGARPLPGFECRCLAPTGQLLLAITDYGSRQGPITVRHLADLVHLLRAEGAAVELPELARDLTAYGLWHGLDKFLAAMEARGLRGRVPHLLDELARLRPAAVAPGAPRRHGRVAAAVDRVVSALDGRMPGRWLQRLVCRAPVVGFMLRAGYRVCGLPIVTRAHSGTQLVECGGVYFLVHEAGICALSLMQGTDSQRRALFELFRSSAARRVIARFELNPS